jgi:protein-S-isoprenylcysteine O-methyltransferase Ste14
LRRQAPPDPARRSTPSLGAIMGWGLVGSVLLFYFAWICIQMAGRSPHGGIAVVLAIVASVVIGLGALFVCLMLGRRGR